MSEIRNQKIDDQILSYLLDHPDAHDTVEGIAEWWLLEQAIKTTVIEVQRALDTLVQQGWLHAETGADSRIHFRIEKTRLEELFRRLGKQ